MPSSPSGVTHLAPGIGSVEGADEGEDNLDVVDSPSPPTARHSKVGPPGSFRTT